MVWETESSVIVMLAKLVENGKKKCEKYWPDYNGTKSYPSMQVTCTQEEVFGCFTARSFTMTRWGATRQITQFHYTTWPDHGVPITTSGLHAFKRAVLGKQQEFGRNKPIVVHCSAGAGRTGTFIAFDSLTMEMNQKDNVNVYQTVLGMRRQRVEMVQTEKQYMLLHKLVAEEYALGTTEVGFGNLGLRIKELERMQGYAREMEKLNSVVLREKHTIQHFRIMDDRFAPASKYNASFIESYDRTKTEMIAAEGPTEATIKGFWGAVLSNQVHTIVSLRSSSEETKHRCMPSLQMPTRNFDNFVVKLLTESDAGNDVTQRELHLSHGAGEQIEIGFYHFDNWLPNSIPSCGDVLELIKKTQKSKLHRSGKVLVYCSDGVGRTGVFFGVLNLIERAKLEGKIDVPWQVKDMREMRQGMVNAEVLYRFIYQCLVEFVSTFDVYSNSIGS
uniref:protein-tyrosine-phosphatase n=1 Tax=Ciona intestinalis TaxID=7719 RepID=Q69HS3_CIOIN|nr:receptor tyrosine phosphatase-like [Ciona intestinalis]AAP91708.1 receptor tyrosine phosphatase-like [Ciona intestinalis]|eukprot:NP_001231969.1 receptor tyrosine phosphatase-like [Ciona intestinalis]